MDAALYVGVLDLYVLSSPTLFDFMSKPEVEDII